MIIPVGQTETAQELILVERQGDEFKQTVIEKVKFVPLVSGVAR